MCEEAARGAKGRMKVDGTMTGEGLETVCAVKGWRPSQADHDEEIGTFRDDVSGEELNPSPVRKTREDEMEECRKRNICVKILVNECTKEVKKESTGSRCTDINKGDDESSEGRSWLAAEEMKR